MPEENRNGEIKFSPHFLLVFSILLGSFLRFYHIGAQPLWLDEAFSYWFSKRTFLELWTIVPKYETNPPLYYTILKIWTLFGSNEAWLRSLSTVMSIGCIPLVFLMGRFLGKSIGGDWLGAGASLMFAVSPVHIKYAQEARTYAMLTFAASLALCAFIWIMRHPEEACTPIIGGKKDRELISTNGIARSGHLAWVTMAFAIIFTLWLHNTSVLFILTLSFIILLWFVLKLRFNKIFFINAMVIAFIVLLLWGPYLIFLLPQAKMVITDFWISKPTALSAANGISWLLIGNYLPSMVSVKGIIKLIAILILIGLAAAGLLNIRRRSGKYISILVFTSIVGPILLELLFSLTVRPIFLERTLIYVSVPFYIAVVAGIMMLRDPKKRVVVIMVISLIFLRWTYNYYRDDQKEPWDKIANIAVQQARNDVVLLVPNFIEIPFSYYAKKIPNNNLQTISLPHPFPSLQGIRSSDIPQINNVVDKSPSIWLITRREDYHDHDRIVFNMIMQKRGLISMWNFKEITVYKFGW